MLQTDVENLKGVGKKVAEALARLKIKTVEDLIWHLPRRYEDYSNISPIKEITPGPVTIQAKPKSVKARYVRKGLHITEAVFSDETDSVRVVWFNQPYRAKALSTDSEYFLSGNFELSNRRYAIMNPSAEKVGDFPKNSARIIPIYKETKGLKSHAIRKHVAACFALIDTIPDSLPDQVVEDNKLLSLAEALKGVHFPDDAEHLKLARQRLGFEELFNLMLANELTRRQNHKTRSHEIKFDVDLAKKFVKTLGFDLTDVQRKAAWDALQDMEKQTPMNRLVEGDVGSGKTVVAAMAIVMAVNQNLQTVLMAPTEILAKQHHTGLKELLDSFNIRSCLLVGSMTAKQKKDTKADIKAGKFDLVVGTHAIIQDDIEFNKLGLAVIDEQHRFGVKQRRHLQQHDGKLPHLLSMTATPIPRTLALTVFGDLDISVINQLPPGRKPVITELASPNSRAQLYSSVKVQLDKGHQAFFVFPLIEDSEKLAAANATSAFEKLSKGEFKDYKLGLVHGKLKQEEKDSIMASFVKGDIDLLVSTTVIEVGVNVPNATVMVIESAERFGLAQLHQLRGRVGRASDQSYCFVVPSSSQNANIRLKQFVTTKDGFQLAEIDLEQRGPGEVYGVAQSGALDLRVARLSDAKLIEATRKAAKQFVDSEPDLVQFDGLEKRVMKLRSMTYLN